MVLTNRERGLIALLVVALLATGVYFALRAMQAYESQLSRRIAGQEIQVNQVSALRQELQRLQAQPQGAVLTGPLIGYVEGLADRIQLKDRIQLNAVPAQTLQDAQGVELKVDKLTLDEMVNLLYVLENAEPAVVIDQLELGPSFSSKDLLRLSMRVLAGGA
jgi:hypothetical protein